jgi:hypothetical protein
MPDEILVESTTSSPSEETQTTEVVQTTEEEKISKAVPYERFKEVIAERNQYKDLLATQQPVVKSTPVVDNDSYEDALKIVDNRIEEKVSKKLEEVNRKIELDRTIQQNPDFFQYGDLIKNKVQENPNLKWDDAYKLAKYEIAQIEAQERGRQQAYQKIEEKKTATVESASKAKSPIVASNDFIDPLARDANGKFLFSTSELEDILPKK